MVSPATFRHPSLLAKVVTTADHISGGRVELGIGTGWSEDEHAAYGFAFRPLRERFDLLDEQLQILLGTWARAGAPDGERFSFAGEHHTLTGLRAEPGPVQTPHPPLIMGGNAGPRAAQLAAAYADEYNTPFPSPGEARERRGRIEAACERTGRAPLPFSAMTTVLVAEDEASLRARADRVRALGGLDALGGSTAGSILTEPPPGWIVGTVESAAEQIRALGDAGVSRIMCQHLLLDDLDGVALLGERVAPLVA
jgi:alkanesulfonate monooxygenase SsuD/methylene tetrahydromethanopterin reductase-like flavin-dependent oxidoreductase (luciferase family)